MAITNAQQYQQLVNKPANGKRPGYRGDNAYGDKSKSEQARSFSAATSRSGNVGGAPTQTRDNSGNVETGGDAFRRSTEEFQQGLIDNAPPEKKNETLQKVVDFFDKRKQAYNFGRSLPGAKKSSFNNLTAYRNYLVSQGADLSTIDRLMEGVDEENAIGFDPFQELAYGYEPEGITDIDKLRGIFKDPTRDPFEKLTAVPQNYSDFMLTQRNNPNLFAAGDLGNFMDKPKPKDLVNPTTGELYTNTEWNALKQDIGQDRGLLGGGNDNNQQQTDPCLGPNPPAYCAVNNDPTEEEDATPSRNLGGLAPRFAGSIFDFDGMADGGRAGAMDGGRMMMMNQEEDDPVGGIMDLETGRQQYFLGKLVKKVTRGVKKIAKSPVGKMALLYGLGSLGASAFGKYQAGTGKGLGFKKFITDSIMGKAIGVDSPAAGNAIVRSGGLLDFIKSNPYKTIGGITALTGLMTPKEEEEKNNDDYYASNTIDYDYVRRHPFSFSPASQMGSRFNVADGGIMRNGYAEGSEEPVAKKTMPLLDMDGQEMDLREEGGFVPLGRMERADDVPARLSKNEFVFTADAVRNAGEGDVDKGAEVMYNMMKNLESGGDVSEESQGLEGAREMFQTSQRLEEVI